MKTHFVMAAAALLSAVVVGAGAGEPEVKGPLADRPSKPGAGR